MKNIPLSNVVTNQLPQHIKQNYDTFLSFIEAYYSFLDQQKLMRNFEELRNIDTTLTEFINYIKNEIAVLAPNLAYDKTFLKNAKALYQAKGTAESYNCLFKLLYNKPVELVYPGEKIFKASGGKWKQDISFFLEIDLDTTFIKEIINKKINIYNPTTKQIHTVLVEKINVITNKIYEIFINHDYFGTLNIDDIITINNVSGKILPSPSKCVVIKGGSNFKVGELFRIPSSIGTDCIIKVTKVDKQGAILRAQIVSYGIGYATNMYFDIFKLVDQNNTLVVDPAVFNENDKILLDLDSIQHDIVHNNNNYYVTINDNTYKITNKITANDMTYASVSQGIIAKVTYNAEYDSNTSNIRNDYFSSDYVGEIVGSFYNISNIPQVEKLSAKFLLQIDTICKYPGYYTEATSLISEDSYIQDGNYYQDFSYVIRINEMLDNYKDIVLALLHPAGNKMFSEYIVENNFELLPVIQKAIYKLFFPQDATPLEPVNPINIYDESLENINYIMLPYITPIYDNNDYKHKLKYLLYDSNDIENSYFKTPSTILQYIRVIQHSTPGIYYEPSWYDYFIDTENIIQNNVIISTKIYLYLNQQLITKENNTNNTNKYKIMPNDTILITGINISDITTAVTKIIAIYKHKYGVINTPTSGNTIKINPYVPQESLIDGYTIFNEHYQCINRIGTLTVHNNSTLTIAEYNNNYTRTTPQ